MNAKKYVASKVVDIDVTTCKTLNHTKERKSFLQTEKKYMLHEIKKYPLQTKFEGHTVKLWTQTRIRNCSVQTEQISLVRYLLHLY